MESWHRLVLASLALAALAAPVARAQGTQAAPMSPEVVKLFEAIDDIDKLRILNPLQFTAEQLESVIAIVERSQRQYNRTLADAAVPPVQGIGDAIASTRAKLLAGGEVPKDFDERVKKLQADLVRRREEVDRTTITRLAADIKALLAPEQFATAVRLAREYLSKGGVKATGTDDQFFNIYIAGTFIAYPRIVPLMRDMHDALNSPTTSSRTSPRPRARRAPA